MDEPEDRQGELEELPGLLPALLLTWAALYLCVVLGMWWYTRLYPADPALALRIHACALASLALLFLWGMAGARAKVAAPAEPEAWLCQHCLKPYVPGAHFCPRCGAPKTFYSGVSPYERVYAQAWILGKAAHHPSRPLHVVGLILVTGPPMLGSLALVAGLALGRVDGWVVSAAPLLVIACLSGALLVYGVRNWRRRKRGVEPVQPEIEYGAPPWFSYDAEWALPEFEEEPDGEEADATAEPG